MQEKMAFAFVVATFVAVVGLILIQRHVTDRVRSVEERVVALQNADAERQDAVRQTRPAETPPESGRISEGGDLADALKSKDALKKLDHILEMLTDMSDEDYEFQLSTVQDLHKFKMQLEALRSMMRRVLRAGNVASNLPAKGAAIDEATRRKFRTMPSASACVCRMARCGSRASSTYAPTRRCRSSSSWRAIPSRATRPWCTS